MPIYALGDSRPVVAASCFVAGTAVLVGDIVLEAGASVWFGAVLRADNDSIRIGAMANIQDNAVLHTDPGFPLEVGARCSVGHGAILHGCSIGEGSLVGMGATILNGATIGPGALIGAGALVTEGVRIPAGSLALGMPARVIRRLSEAEIATMAEAAAHYVDKGGRHLASLTKLQRE
jgi:carbonic anhydrase/acetyltransferase-like protein (isoleucine patch superfamily)